MPPRSRVQVSITAENSGLKRGVDEAESSLGRLGAQGAKTTEQLNSHARSVIGSWTGVAKAAGEAAIAYASFQGAKTAVETTDDLARATLKLHRNLGLSIESASQFAGVAKVRGIDNKQLAQSFGTLSRQTVAAEGGTKKAADAFRALGVTQDQLKRGNFQDTLMRVADGFGHMHGGAQRAAIGMQLFGRGWQTLLPLMASGSKGLRDQLALADKYGVTLHGHTVKSMEEMLQAQRESKFATLGLQVAFGTYLAPAMTKAMKAMSDFVGGMRTGTGAGGKFADAMKPIVATLTVIARFLGNHPKLIAAAVIAWGAYKAAGVAAAVVTRGKLLASFAGLGPKAAVGGAEAGASFGTAASTSARTRMLGLNWASVGRTIGLAMGAAIALEIANKVAAGLGDLLSSVGDAGVAVDSSPLVQRGRGLAGSKNVRSAIDTWKRRHPHVDPVTTSPGRLAQLGYPGLIPGAPGVPKGYTPHGAPVHHAAPHHAPAPHVNHSRPGHAATAATASVSSMVDAMASGAPVAHAAGMSSVSRWAGIAAQASQRYGIPVPDLLGLIQVESGGNINAVSPVGAFGLTQFMPATAAEYGVHRGDAVSQIMGAAHYLSDLGFGRNPTRALNQYNGAQTINGRTNPYAGMVLSAARGYGSTPSARARSIVRGLTAHRQAATRRATAAPRKPAKPKGPNYGSAAEWRAALTKAQHGTAAWALRSLPGQINALADRDMQAIQDALDTIDLHVQAGDIDDATGTAQKHAVVASALRGGYGFINDQQTLQLRATDHGLDTSSSGSGVSLADAIQANTDAVNALKDEQRRTNEFATSVANVTSMQAVRALSDVISGELGGQYAARAQTASAGSVWRA